MNEVALRRIGLARAAIVIAVLLTPTGQAARTEVAGGTRNAAAGHWEGYIDGSVAVRLDLCQDGDFWNGRATVFSLKEPLTVGGVEVASLFLAATRVDARIHCDSWGDCALRAYVEANEMSGTLTIRGKRYMLRMRRDQAAPELEPWEPDLPVPYAAESVAFMSGRIRIGGELTMPSGPGPHPSVVLLSGSGASDRDGSVFAGQGSVFYRVIADQLSRRGIAVLRTDDRGIGASTGDYESATLSELADDAVAAAAYLRGRPQIRPEHIALLGFSEGAIAAPLATTRTKAVSLLVLLAPEAVVGAVGEIERERREAERTDQPDWVVRVKKQRVDLRRRLFPLFLDGADRETIRRELRADGRFDEEVINAAIEELVTGRRGFGFKHDAGAALENVKVPILAIYGGRDAVVPPDLNVPALRAAVARGGNPNVTVKVFEDYDHLMSRPFNPKVFRGLSWARRTVAPDVLSLVAEWLELQNRRTEKRDRSN